MGHRSPKGIESVDLAAKISPRPVHAIVEMGVLFVNSALLNRALEFSGVEDWHETMSWVESTSNRLLLEHNVLLDQCIAPALCPYRTAPLALTPQRNGKVFVPDYVWVIFRYELVNMTTEKDGARGVFPSVDKKQT